MTLPKLTVASARHLAYAPQYVAQNLGLFADAGVEVELVSCPAGDSAIINTLKNGEADLVLGSVLFALRMAQENLSPVLVAQSNQNTRHWLMAREDCPGFGWDQLRGSTVVVYPTNVPTPWIAFRQALFNKGVALDDISLAIGFSAEQSVTEFRRGVGDFLLVDPESVDARAELKEIASVADALGRVPWSIYCTTRKLAAAHDSAIVAFRRAISIAASRLYEMPALEAAHTLAGSFADKSEAEIAAQVVRYQQARLWVSDAMVDPAHVARWNEALRRGGLMPKGLDLMQLCQKSS
jgi:NitT/TauT family transport system substrate-binding protein